MELHFFKEFLMISHPTTVFLLLVFLLILAMIHHLEKKGTSFGKLVTIGTVSGALLGIFIQVLAGFPDAPTKVVFIKEATKWYSLVGGGFIDLIRMRVVPLVLTSIIHVILHMNEGTNLKKLVGAMLATNLGMVALAAIVGLSLGSLFGLGAGSSAVEGASKMRDVKPVVDTFRALIPMNPVKAMADTNVIAVVIFGVVIGGIAQLKPAQTAWRPLQSSLTSSTSSWDGPVILSLASCLMAWLPCWQIPLPQEALKQSWIWAFSSSCCIWALPLCLLQKRSCSPFLG